MLWRINFVLTKFLPNALLFVKLQAKIHDSSIRLYVPGQITQAKLLSLHSWSVTIDGSGHNWLRIDCFRLSLHLFIDVSVRVGWRSQFITVTSWCRHYTQITHSKRASVRERYNHCVPERASWMKRGISFQWMLNECNAHIWDLFNFSSLITLWIPVSSVAPHSNTGAARSK